MNKHTAVIICMGEHSLGLCIICSLLLKAELSNIVVVRHHFIKCEPAFLKILLSLDWGHLK